MYRVILASSNGDVETKLADKILDFLDTQCNYARQHSFLLHELPTKSFRRTIAGKVYVFKLSRSTLHVSYNGENLGKIDLNQGYKNTDATKLAQKVIKHSQKE